MDKKSHEQLTLSLPDPSTDADAESVYFIVERDPEPLAVLRAQPTPRALRRRRPVGWNWTWRQMTLTVGPSPEEVEAAHAKWREALPPGVKGYSRLGSLHGEPTAEATVPPCDTSAPGPSREEVEAAHTKWREGTIDLATYTEWLGRNLFSGADAAFEEWLDSPAYEEWSDADERLNGPLNGRKVVPSAPPPPRAVHGTEEKWERAIALAPPWLTLDWQDVKYRWWTKH